MSANFYYPPTKNAVQKTLAAQLLNTATTGDAITFSDVDGIPNKPGILVINAVDANGLSTPANREYISYSSISGTTVIIETRNVDGSASAKTHLVGAIVDFVPDVVLVQRIIDQFLIGHSIAGAHNANLAFTTPTLTTPVVNGQWGTGGSLSLIHIDKPLATGEFSNGNAGASLAIDWSNGDRQNLTVNATLSLYHKNAITGQVLTARIVENATGSFPITFAQANTKFPTGATGSMVTSASAINLAVIYFDGTNYLTQTAPGFN